MPGIILTHDIYTSWNRVYDIVPVTSVSILTYVIDCIMFLVMMTWYVINITNIFVGYFTFHVNVLHVPYYQVYTISYALGSNDISQYMIP